MDEGLYDAVLQPKSREQQIEDLAKAGFPVGEYFPGEIDAEAEVDEEISELPPIDEEELCF